MNRRRRRTSVYAFHQDKDCLFLGQRLSPWLRSMRSEFVFVVLLITVVELALMAWPIVATVIWKARAFLTWIHFIYLIRLGLLVVGAFEVEFPHRLWGTGDYSLGWNTVRLSGGLSAYGTLAWWARLAFLHGLLLTAVFLIVTLATIPIFLDSSSSWPMLLWGLTLAFHLIVVVESLVAPFVIWELGVRRPVSSAYRKAKRQGSEGRPRCLLEARRTRERSRRLQAARNVIV